VTGVGGEGWGSGQVWAAGLGGGKGAAGNRGGRCGVRQRLWGQQGTVGRGGMRERVKGGGQWKGVS